MSKKSIMITGVSTGIGLGTLSYFVKNGFHVYGSVRNSKDASRLKKIYKDNFTPCLLYTSPSPRDYAASRMPSSA